MPIFMPPASITRFLPVSPDENPKRPTLAEMNGLGFPSTPAATETSSPVGNRSSFLPRPMAS